MQFVPSQTTCPTTAGAAFFSFAQNESLEFQPKPPAYRPSLTNRSIQ